MDLINPKVFPQFLITLKNLRRKKEKLSVKKLEIKSRMELVMPLHSMNGPVLENGLDF